jgi:hypothetical protein
MKRFTEQGQRRKRGCSNLESGANLKDDSEWLYLAANYLKYPTL